MVGKQDKIYFTPDLLFKLALELNILGEVFINLDWTKNYDHRPQTLCYPAGFSYQLVQWGYQIFTGLSRQRVYMLSYASTPIHFPHCLTPTRG